MASRVRFRAHALRRMFERGISVEDVEAVLESREAIESYPDDQPYPSRLLLWGVDVAPASSRQLPSIQRRPARCRRTIRGGAEFFRSLFRRRKS